MTDTLVGSIGGVCITLFTIYWMFKPDRTEEKKKAGDDAFVLEMLDRGLSPDDVERMLRVRGTKANAVSVTVPQSAPDAAEVDGEATLDEFVRILGICNASPADIEETLASVQAARPATQKSMLRAVHILQKNSEDEITSDQVRAVVRALARSGGYSTSNDPASKGVPPVTDSEVRLAEAIRLVDRPDV